MNFELGDGLEDVVRRHRQERVGEHQQRDRGLVLAQRDHPSQVPVATQRFMRGRRDAIMNAVRLILASASPRRADLLREAGIDVEIQPADVDEDVEPGEAPEAYVRRVAEAKGRAISERAPGRFVLAADTAVVVDGEILGKPASPEDAARMLRMLSGRSHQVISGVCLMKDGEPGGRDRGRGRLWSSLPASRRLRSRGTWRAGNQWTRPGVMASKAWHPGS